MFEDTKGVIRSRKLKKDIQKTKRTNNNLRNTTHKTKDRATRTPLKIEGSINYSTPASEFGLAWSSAIFGFSNTWKRAKKSRLVFILRHAIECVDDLNTDCTLFRKNDFDSVFLTSVDKEKLRLMFMLKYAIAIYGFCKRMVSHHEPWRNCLYIYSASE